MLYFGASFTGLCYGTIFPLMPAAIADFYGVKNLGVNYGFLFTAFGIAGIFGPIVGGTIAEKTGSFAASYAIAVVMLAIAAVLAYVIRPPKAVAEPESAAEST
jgi:OFA family oxalate/formate antiporter-like MFS transporter